MLARNNNLNYRSQGDANLLAFFEKDYDDRRNVLFKLLHEFEQNEVKWGLAFSSNLFFRGITDDFHDFDIIVSIDSIHEVEQIMRKLDAILLDTGGNGYCQSDIYMHYRIDTCDIDIIAGFRILTFGTSYYYAYKLEEIEQVDLEYFQIPMLSVESLFIMYAMMEGWQPRRRFKRVFIENFLKTEGIKFPDILSNSLEKYNLPNWIAEKVKGLIF